MTKSNTTPFVPTAAELEALLDNAEAAGRALDRALKLAALDESFAPDLDRAFDEARTASRDLARATASRAAVKRLVDSETALSDIRAIRPASRETEPESQPQYWQTGSATPAACAVTACTALALLSLYHAAACAVLAGPPATLMILTGASSAALWAALARRAVRLHRRARSAAGAAVRRASLRARLLGGRQPLSTPAAALTAYTQPGGKVLCRDPRRTRGRLAWVLPPSQKKFELGTRETA